MFNGVYTALITPFKNDGVDYDSFEQIIEHQISGGVDGVWWFSRGSGADLPCSSDIDGSH